MNDTGEKYCLHCDLYHTNRSFPEQVKYCSFCGNKLILAKEKKHQKWLEIAIDLKCIRLQLYNNLIPKLKHIPKRVYINQLNDLLFTFEQLRSNLENSFSKECPKQFNKDIFYGGDYEQK